MSAAVLPALTPYLATAGIGWLYYRRIRRSFGRQLWQPKRTITRLVLVSLVAASLVCAAVFLPHVGAGIAVGAVLGAALGVFALKHTHAQATDGKRYYTPNPWIGGGLTLLLLGRLAWRWSQGALTGSSAQMGQQVSPLTLGIAATLIAYSLVYSSGLLLRMRKLAPERIAGD
jgi:membrane associated rhomboid family serine protease